VKKIPKNSTADNQCTVDIGAASLAGWAVGMLPYKDGFFSSQKQQWDHVSIGTTSAGRQGSEWWGQQEPHPQLQAVVSSLSAGPVGICDCVNSSDATLIMQTAMANGTLLKPDRPAFPPDSWWAAAAAVPDGPLEQLKTIKLTHTYSTLAVVEGRDEQGGAPTRTRAAEYVLLYKIGWNGTATTSGSPFDLTSAELGVPAVPAWAWLRTNLSAPLRMQDIYPFDASHPLCILPPAASEVSAWGDFQLWTIVPKHACSGSSYTFLGETDKIVSLSRTRFRSLSCPGDGGAAVLIAGAAGEMVTVAWLVDDGARLVQFACTIGTACEVHLNVLQPPSTCTQLKFSPRNSA
jgi:hypothetical protein